MEEQIARKKHALCKRAVFPQAKGSKLLYTNTKLHVHIIQQVTSLTSETKWLSTLNSVSIRCDWMDGNWEVALGSRESITEIIIRNRGDWTFRLSPYCLVKSLCAFSASSQMTWQDLLGSISPPWFFNCMSLLISLLNLLVRYMSWAVFQKMSFVKHHFGTSLLKEMV